MAEGNFLGQSKSLPLDEVSTYQDAVYKMSVLCTGPVNKTPQFLSLERAHIPGLSLVKLWQLNLV